MRLREAAIVPVRRDGPEIRRRKGHKGHASHIMMDQARDHQQEREGARS